MAKRVLIAVAEDGGREALHAALAEEGYALADAASGADAVSTVHRLQPDAVVLDARLGNGTTPDLVAALRQETTAPILVLTGEADLADQLGCLRAGADVCVPRPYSLREVQARVLALIRRVDLSNGRAQRVAEVEQLGDFRLDRAARTVHIAGTEVELTVKQFDLLSFLLAHAGRVQSRERILEEVWGNALGDRRTVNVHVRWLREKLSQFEAVPLRITTVTGAGYRVDRPEDGPADDHEAQLHARTATMEARYQQTQLVADALRTQLTQLAGTDPESTELARDRIREELAHIQSYLDRARERLDRLFGAEA